MAWHGNNIRFRRVEVERKERSPVGFKAPLGKVGNTNVAWDAAYLHSTTLTLRL